MTNVFPEIGSTIHITKQTIGGVVEAIQAAVCRKYGISRGVLLSDRIGGELVPARHEAIKLAHKLTGATYGQLARLFNRDHTTIRYAIHGKKRAA